MKFAALVFVGALALAACGGSSGSSGVSGISANAGEDFSVAVGTAPEFDACGSEGVMSNFEWVIVGAPEANQEEVGKALRESLADCSFVLESAMTIDDVGTWTIELTVTGEDGTSTDQVVVEVTQS